jgi:fatty acid desaturase
MSHVPESSANSTGAMSWVREARHIVRDQFVRSPGLYWIDLLLSAGFAWACTVVYYLAPPWSWWQIAALIMAGIAFYRAGTFMHEIIHMKRGEMRGFKTAWSLMVGIPLLMPWILYRNHGEHHSRIYYGTPGDGEYLPLAVSPPAEILKYLAMIPVLPLLAVLRFGIAGPLSHLHRPFREWLLEHGTAYVINPYYHKRLSGKLERHLLLVEWLCFGWILFWVVLTVLGPVSWIHWLMAWLLLAWSAGLNWVRTLAAHGYGNDGKPMSYAEQVDDSINITGQTWLTSWLFPVGLRYHALHHLFPTLPYHNLGRAHQRLIAELPTDCPYHRVNHQSYFRVIADLWHSTWQSSRNKSPLLAWREYARS